VTGFSPCYHCCSGNAVRSYQDLPLASRLYVRQPPVSALWWLRDILDAIGSSSHMHRAADYQSSAVTYSIEQFYSVFMLPHQCRGIFHAAPGCKIARTHTVWPFIYHSSMHLSRQWYPVTAHMPTTMAFLPHSRFSVTLLAYPNTCSPDTSRRAAEMHSVLRLQRTVDRSPMHVLLTYPALTSLTRKTPKHHADHGVRQLEAQPTPQDQHRCLKHQV
jgi:hypothetical protein